MCSNTTSAQIESSSVNSEPFSFIEIFEKDITIKNQKVKADSIVIPKIQRDYAQGRQSPKVDRIRSKFLDSLYGAVTNKPIILDFIFGDLNSENKLIPLDGQQRLTTLFLLHWYAARKDNIPEAECTVLGKFSYATRYSARDFCTELAIFSPDISNLPQGKNALSELIIDQHWFPLEWKKDPTISSMLVMLDAINDKFKDVTNLWQSLKDGAIRFYFLALTDMGLTDELYIKMNSRGKPLTLFENFKADLDGYMRKAEPAYAERIMRKIDGAWNDLLWNYCEKDAENADNAIPDNEFINYFKFICLLIHYRDNSTRFQREKDVLDMTKKYFTGNIEVVKKNIQMLESAFDCWCTLPNNITPAKFLDSYLSKTHQNGKIIIGLSKYNTDIFMECIKSDRLPLGRTVLLYAIIVYLQNRSTITDDDFRTRLRCINNLIQNSEDELAERSDNSRMKNILDQTCKIMTTGNIDEKRSLSFNVYQLEEEKAKKDHLNNNPTDKDNIYLLEDHPLLYGQISIIGLNNLKNAENFCSLFKCNKDLINCALMATGDYGQLYRNGWRWLYGSSVSDEPWKELFHLSSSREMKWFNNTQKTLNTLLATNNAFDNDKLKAIIDSFIKECQNKKEFPWRYYFVRYDIFRPYSYGRYSTKDTFIPIDKENYLKKAMQTQTLESVSTYLPFNVWMLNRTANVAENTRKFLKSNYIESYNDCYKLFDQNTFTETAGEKPLNITQNAAGIDTVDRIQLLENHLNNDWKNK